MSFFIAPELIVCNNSALRHPRLHVFGDAKTETFVKRGLK